MAQHMVNIPSALENSVCTTLSNAVLRKYPLGQVVASVVQTLCVFTDCFDYLFYPVVDRAVKSSNQDCEVVTFPCVLSLLLHIEFSHL